MVTAISHVVSIVYATLVVWTLGVIGYLGATVVINAVEKSMGRR